MSKEISPDLGNTCVQDLSKCRRIGVDEKFIKFRPSPNFRNMKKFIKNKIDNREPSPNPMEQIPIKSFGPSPTQDNQRYNSIPVRHSSTEAPFNAVVQTPPNIVSSSPRQNGEPKNILKPVAGQPPLPLDPPPPDSPPNLNIQLKQEVEDNEFDESSTRNENEQSITNTEELITKFKVDQTEETEKQKPTICRDFIRGSCSRSGTCKYAHECDVSQLVGVYTFCRNYQNSVCTYTNCRYVHATVFEEQRFYREGILPPEALSHLKKANLQPPPPPPPPPTETHAPEIAPSMSTGESTPHSSMENTSHDSSVPIINCVPTMNMETSPVLTSPLSVDLKEPKKCENCKTKEFRVQYYKEKVDELSRSNEERNNKILQLDKKNRKLYSLIIALLKPSYNKNTLSNILPSMTQNPPQAEKEKNALEELQVILGNRISAASEENKNTIPQDLQMLVAKLLQYASSEQNSDK